MVSLPYYWQYGSFGLQDCNFRIADDTAKSGLRARVRGHGFAAASRLLDEKPHEVVSQSVSIDDG